MVVGCGGGGWTLPGSQEAEENERERERERKIERDREREREREVTKYILQSYPFPNDLLLPTRPHFLMFPHIPIVPPDGNQAFSTQTFGGHSDPNHTSEIPRLEAWWHCP
jgi:hypothetical protein